MCKPRRILPSRPRAWPHFFSRHALVMALSAAAASTIPHLSFGAGLEGTANAEEGTRIHLRGMARIDAHAARSQGRIVLRGRVTDENDAPAPGMRVAVQLTRGARESFSLSLASPDDCAAEGATTGSRGSPRTAQSVVLDGPDRIFVSTDAMGRFCVRLAVPTDRYVAHVEARASGLVDGARLDIPVDLALENVTLRFDPERVIVALDDAMTVLYALASTEDDGIIAVAGGLPLTLSNESGSALGNATTDASGRARFVVPSARMGPAGKGELRISFAGSTDAGRAAYVAAIERRTSVRIEAPDAMGGRLPAGSPESGVTLRIVASAACASQGCAGFPTGTVEVRSADDGPTPGVVIAAATLERGETRVTAKFATPTEAGDVPLQVRYLPDAPWFQTGERLTLLQPVRPATPWNKLALALAGLLVIAWLGAGRFADLPVRGRRSPRSLRGLHADESRARIDVVRADASGAGTWTGHIVDAHEGTAVPATRVAIERPGFKQIEIIAETITDAAGAFTVPSVDVRPGDQLVAEGPLHGTVRHPVPPRGELQIALVARRRALLDRLVSWGRRRGYPFDASPDPTPAHIRRTAPAAGRAEPALQEWADAVERAAYAGAPVNAEAEAKVDRLAPEDAAPARGTRAR
jgi:hypothetical protein